MYTSTSGQSALFKQMELIANNLANANTAGYKAENVLFEKVMKDKQAGPGKLDPNEFVSIRGSYTDLSEGSMKSTGNPLDVGIQGKGFFVVQTPQGERYTRSGEFSLNEQGQVVTQAGHTVLGRGGAITISGGNPEVATDGTIKVNGQTVDRFRLVDLEGVDLERESAQMFRATNGTPIDLPEFEVVGGAIETSNVNPVKELTNMIYASRMMEAMNKTHEASGRMTRARNQVLGRT